MTLKTYPVNNLGFIDEKAIYQFAYNKLKLPLGSLDDLDITEYCWLVEGHIEALKEKYEMISYAVRVGYISAKTGKNIEMFKKDVEESKQKNTISLEDREIELKKIEKIMG